MLENPIYISRLPNMASEVVEWKDEDVHLFIVLWEEYFPRLIRNGRNSIIFHEMAQRLNELSSSPPKQGPEIKEKMNLLKRQYK